MFNLPDKEIVKTYLRANGPKLAIYGVMVGVSLAVAFLATGDIAEAARHRNR